MKAHLRAHVEALIVLTLETCSLEGLDLRKQGALGLSIGAELGHIEVLAHELYQLGLRQEVDRVVEHVEDVLVTELPDRRA
jgi:hypothetical protein